MTTLDADVAIVGCGPTGAVLANLLGARGRRVVVLERDRGVFPVPRATHLDGETQRHLQATGLWPQLEPWTSPFGGLTIVDADGTELLAAHEPVDPALGDLAPCYFDQPEVERALRAGLARYPDVTFRTGHEVVQVGDAGDAVRIEARGPEGPTVLMAGWVIGCDGGRSLVRGAVGGPVDVLAPPRRWVVVDTILRDPTDGAHLPSGFQYRLASDRLVLYAHGFGLHRRWEYRIRDDEPDPDPGTVLRWLEREVDPARVLVRRIAPYTHRAHVARRWRRGRVLLAGDAAHLMPPFAGQGLCAGVRDAVGLAWRLDAVLAGASPRLLDDWEVERRAHVTAVTEGALFLGRRLDDDTPARRLLRRGELRLAAALPWVRGVLERRGVRRPALAGGTAHPSVGAGTALPRVRDGAGWLDDRLGDGPVLLCRPPDDEARARAEGVTVEVVGPGHPLDAWLTSLGAPAAIVRPDRVVFGSGAVPDLCRAWHDALSGAAPTARAATG